MQQRVWKLGKNKFFLGALLLLFFTFIYFTHQPTSEVAGMAIYSTPTNTPQPKATLIPTPTEIPVPTYIPTPTLNPAYQSIWNNYNQALANYDKYCKPSQVPISDQCNQATEQFNIAARGIIILNGGSTADMDTQSKINELEQKQNELNQHIQDQQYQQEQQQWQIEQQQQAIQNQQNDQEIYQQGEQRCASQGKSYNGMWCM